jgi:amino acid adenylation domain-containing protein
MGNWTSDSTTLGSVRDDLVSLFVRVAQMNLSAVAVQNHSYFLTYDELHRRSSISARYVSNYVGPGDIVCVHADRTVNWIIAIYAVLKAGATYCPLDPDLPPAVRDINFEIAVAKLFLTGSVAAKSTKPPSAKYCFSIEESFQEREIAPGPLQRTPSPDSTAYLCFTSGSTGKPKGVLYHHRGLVAFQKDFQVRLCARLGWKIAQFMSPAFDGSTHEIFSALSYGATLVLKDASSPFAHLKAADAAMPTPSMAAALDVHEFQDFKIVYLIGEAVPQDVCNAWADKKRLFNMYGPTEASCDATIKELAPSEPVTLGNPNPSTRVYVLDSQRKLVPWGVVGEIYLAGVQVAAGYIGRPDETATKFLLDTFNPQYKGERMYKTGDCAYWKESGELAFLGREDCQIKLRGFRIDLDDLEARMIRANENCTSVAVVMQDGRLVALVQPANLDLTLFKSRLVHHIPGYALPSQVQAVSSFPTTRIGKLDYKAIAAMAFPDAD